MKRLIILPLSVIIFSCSKAPKEIGGLYVHSSGVQMYYDLSVKIKSGNSYDLRLEGLPLERIKSTEWTKSCSGELSSGKISCLGNLFRFESGKVTVKYSSGEEQIFISDKLSIEEELTKFEETKVK